MELEIHQLEMKYEHLRIYDSRYLVHLQASLKVSGQQSPVAVVMDEENRYVLIDGYMRVWCLQRLGEDVVNAVVVTLSETEALIGSHGLVHSRPRSALEDGWFLRELKDVHLKSLSEIALRLGRSKSWVCRRLALAVELPEEVQTLVRDGRLCAHAAQKYMVPLARANREDCIILAEKLRGSSLSSRQIERVYIGYKKGTGEQRRRIVEAPQLYCKACEKIEPVGEKMSAARKQLTLANSVLMRVEQAIKEELYLEHMLSDPDELRRLWGITMRLIQGLNDRLQENFDVRLRCTGGDIEVETRRPGDTCDSAQFGGISQLGQESDRRKNEPGSQLQAGRDMR